MPAGQPSRHSRRSNSTAISSRDRASPGKSVVISAWLAMSDRSWLTRDLGATAICSSTGAVASLAQEGGLPGLSVLGDVCLDDRDTKGAGSDLSCHRRPDLMRGKPVRGKSREVLNRPEQAVP